MGSFRTFQILNWGEFQPTSLRLEIKDDKIGFLGPKLSINHE
jgi:hypothetical protein